MSSLEIPFDQWGAFLKRFSLRHLGWLVDMDVLDSGMGAQVAGSNLPLEGIVSNTNAPGEGTLSIFLGEGPEGRFTKNISAPLRIWLQHSPLGTDQGLQIEAKGSSRTLLRFRSALPVDMVDGIA
jgi:hypothetical protein